MSRPRPALEPTDRSVPAARAFAVVLDGYRHDAMAETEATLAGEVEPLHQFRVAMRRARGLLAGAKGVIPRDRRRDASTRLKAMADLTSPVRDLDVLLEDLPGLVAAVGSAPHDRPAIALREVLVASRKGPLDVLHAAVSGEQGSDLLRAWARAAEVNMVGGAARGRRALRATGEVADEDLGASWQRCRRLGEAALGSDDLEHWHELRKAMKRFRYQLEAFAPLYPDEQVKRVRKDLRSLQDVLGRLQDHRIQLERFRGVSTWADATGDEGAGVLARAVASHLEHRLVEVHAGCAQAWSTFDSKSTRKDVEVLVTGSN